MFATRKLGATQARLAKYANSGDVWEDKSRVVGYAAVVFTR
jgi:AmmeMemoRadiSam system protein B